MDLLAGFWDYAIPFLVILTVLVFVHELGHYLVARSCGVRVEVFSIGFGPEIFGRTDRAGTRWKFSLVPLGGYVKMFGETVATGAPEDESGLSAEERAVSFQHKSLPKRTAVVSAGPLANFLFAVVVLTGLFGTLGQPFTPPRVGGVQPGSAAEGAGIQEGDVIQRIDGSAIERFEQIQWIVRDSAGVPLDVVVLRDATAVPLVVTPQLEEVTDHFGNVHEIGLLGIQSVNRELVRHDLATALWRASSETLFLTGATLKAVGQIIVGTRTAEELGGPLRIAQISGEVAQGGVFPVIWFLAVLSINLGLINLFPIPMLDGGHLLFYAAEAVRGKPLGPRAQEVGFGIGLALVIGLMLFVTWNDLVQLRVFEFLKGLLT
jgi:regulator of sigma E protease